MALPPPSHNQAYCNVSALEGGIIRLPLRRFVQDADPSTAITAPVLSFLIQHSTKTSEKFLFDLGLRKDWHNYPPAVVKLIETLIVDVPQDVVESLAKGDLSPTDITTCCLSHVHFDHVGDTRPFTKCTFLVGGAAETLFNPGYPTKPTSSFAESLLPADRTTFMSLNGWKPIGPFPRAYDFFGDGSLYIIDAPGHLAGHINVLARTSPDGGWIFLAGDSAHDWSLINGNAQISQGPPAWPSASGCAHVNKKDAEEHIGRIRELTKEPRVRVLLAHDTPWYAENKATASFWPGKIATL